MNKLDKMVALTFATLCACAWPILAQASFGTGLSVALREAERTDQKLALGPWHVLVSSTADAPGGREPVFRFDPNTHFRLPKGLGADGRYEVVLQPEMAPAGFPLKRDASGQAHAALLLAGQGRTKKDLAVSDVVALWDESVTGFRLDMSNPLIKRGMEADASNLYMLATFVGARRKDVTVLLFFHFSSHGNVDESQSLFLEWFDLPRTVAEVIYGDHRPPSAMELRAAYDRELRVKQVSGVIEGGNPEDYLDIQYDAQLRDRFAVVSCRYTQEYLRVPTAKTDVPQLTILLCPFQDTQPFLPPTVVPAGCPEVWTPRPLDNGLVERYLTPPDGSRWIVYGLVWLGDARRPRFELDPSVVERLPSVVISKEPAVNDKGEKGTKTSSAHVAVLATYGAVASRIDGGGALVMVRSGPTHQIELAVGEGAKNPLASLGLVGLSPGAKP